MTVKPIRDGFHTVTPYLFAEGAARLIDFVSAAFDGEVTSREEHPDGSTMHAEMRVGGSMLMLGEASGEFGPIDFDLSVCNRLRHPLPTGIGCRWNFGF